jgi:tetratricopeptide (TPR) repeat protein
VLAQDDVDVIINAGIELFTLGEYELALEKFDEALEIEKSGFAYNWRGFTHLLLGNLDESLADQEQAANRGESFGYIDGALVYAIFEKHDDAISYFGFGMEERPDYAFPAEDIGAVPDYEFIITVYSLVLEKYPENYIALMMRGNAHANLDDFANARADYEAALEIQPDMVFATDSLGMLTERERFVSGEICTLLEGIEIAGILRDGEAVSGTIGSNEEVWCFIVTSPTTVTITMEKTKGTLNPLLILLTEDGALLSQNNDLSRTDKDAQIVYNFDISGVFLVVASRSGRVTGRSSGEYDLTLTMDMDTGE